MVECRLSMNFSEMECLPASNGTGTDVISTNWRLDNRRCSGLTSLAASAVAPITTRFKRSTK
jgi:hypothetical protein